MISLTSPTKTRAHDWPAGGKLALLCLSTLALFMTDNLLVHLCVAGAVIGAYALGGSVFLRAGLINLRILWPFVVIVGVWHTWTQEWTLGAVIILRMISAVALANLVTMTTRLSDMIGVVRVLTSPLRRVGLRSEVLETSVALVIRLTPVLVQKGSQLTQSWRARSARRAGWRVILPFTVLALDDADHVAEALKARGGITPIQKD